MSLGHRFGEQKLRAAQPYAHRAIAKAPGILLSGGRDRTVAGQAPDPPGKAVQSIAHFIQHPQAHRSVRRQRQGREFRG